MIAVFATGARSLHPLLYEHGVRRPPQSPGPVVARKSRIWTRPPPVLRVRMQQQLLAPSAKRWALAVRRTVPAACSRPTTVPATRRLLRGTPEQATTSSESRRCRRSRSGDVSCSVPIERPVPASDTCCAQTYKNVPNFTERRGRFDASREVESGWKGMGAAAFWLLPLGFSLAQALSGTVAIAPAERLNHNQLMCPAASADASTPVRRESPAPRFSTGRCRPTCARGLTAPRQRWAAAMSCWIVDESLPPCWSK